MRFFVIYQLLVFGFIVSHVESSCTVEDFVDMGLMERFVQSEYVVYGRTIGHTARKVITTDKSYYAIDASFEVHCVFKKGDGIINSEITILDLSPRDECSGTPVTKLLRVGDLTIVALKDEEDGKFSLDEILPLTTAAVRATKAYFFSLARICDLQAWEAPAGATINQCPVCGISDFDPEVAGMNVTVDRMSVCLSTGSYIVSDMASACDIYTEYSLGDITSKTCVPADYNGACALLSYRTASPKCDCSNKKYPKVNVGAGEMVIPNMILLLTMLGLSI
ncbi:hypothetical protein ACF0H5_015985 [Mactra antiquata]